jgi:hypothetical protein
VRRVALLSLALLALLGLVAVASSGERGLSAGGEGGRAPSTTFWDYLVSVTFAVALLGAALVVWALATGRGQDLTEQRKQARLLTGIFIAALVVGMAVGARALDLRAPGFGPDDSGRAGAPADPDRDGARALPEDAYTPQLRLLPIVVLLGSAAAAVFTYLEVRRRRKPRGLPGEHELADELAALLDETLDDLRAEPDPRRAVIAAYARTERTLAGYGFARRPFEAPLEYLDRIAAPLHDLLPSARRLVFELTHLFERAKFSAHDIDVEMKEDAIRTLAALREELRQTEAA